MSETCHLELLSIDSGDRTDLETIWEDIEMGFAANDDDDNNSLENESVDTLSEPSESIDGSSEESVHDGDDGGDDDDSGEKNVSVEQCCETCLICLMEIDPLKSSLAEKSSWGNGFKDRNRICRSSFCSNQCSFVVHKEW